MNQQTYNALPGLNHSGMKWLEKSPAHYQTWKQGKIIQSSPALELGAAIHCAILEPEKYKQTYVCLPDTSHADTPAKKAALTKAAKKEYQDTDKILLSYQDFNTVLKIFAAVMQHPYARYLIEQSEPEKVFTWTDKDSGAACKCRADLMMHEQGILSDLKTTQDASPEGFSLSVAKYRLHRQASFYLDGCEAQRFNFIAVEKNPPYGVVVYSVPDYILDAGRQLYKPLAHLYQRCVENDEWPNYSHDVNAITLPAWAIYDEAAYEESGGTEPALCLSTDSINGHYNTAIPLPEHLAKLGTPSGNCKNCVFANYGTKPKPNGNGRGQACQQRRFLLMLMPGARIPYLVSIPPSGLKNAKKYLVGLQAMGLEYWQVLTTVKLEADKNRDGIKYAKARFMMSDRLPASFLKPLEKYRNEFGQQLPMANITAHAKSGESFIAAAEHQAVIRTDTRDVPAIHGVGYKLVTHEDVYSAFDDALHRSNLDLNGMHCDEISYNGARAVRTYVFPEHSMRIGRFGDVVDLQLRVVNSYDDSAAFNAIVGAYRLVCTNGLVIGNKWAETYARHTESFDLESILHKLNGALDAYCQNAEMWQRWTGRTLNEIQAETVIGRLPVLWG